MIALFYSFELLWLLPVFFIKMTIYENVPPPKSMKMPSPTPQTASYISLKNRFSDYLYCAFFLGKVGPVE